TAAAAFGLSFFFAASALGSDLGAGLGSLLGADSSTLASAAGGSLALGSAFSATAGAGAVSLSSSSSAGGGAVDAGFASGVPSSSIDPPASRSASCKSSAACFITVRSSGAGCSGSPSDLGKKLDSSSAAGG